MGIISVDIGGTAVKSALFTSAGELIDQKETPSNGKLGGQRVMETVEQVIASYDGFEAIGVSTTGQVNGHTGTIVFANENVPNYTGMPVADILQDRFHVPVAVENDVNAATIGEAYHGAGRGTKDFLCLTYGTGVGGAIVMDGKIYGGHIGVAGEMGHMITHPRGLLCGCGQHGCYEQYASATALCRESKVYNAAYDNGRAIFAAFESDPGLQSIIDKWIEEILIGLASLTHIFNPSLFVLGGGVLTQPYVLNAIASQLPNHIMPSYQHLRIAGAQLQNQAGVYGAMVLAQQLLRGDA